MKTHATQTDGRGRGALRHLDNERGMLLVIVMVVTLVLATLAASTLVNSFLERSLAKNQNYASIALQSAEGGVAAGLTWVRENQALLPASSPWADNANWPKTLTRTLPGGGGYRVTMRFKRTWYDYNGNGNCSDPGESSGYHDGAPDIPDDGTHGGGMTCPGKVVLYNSAASTTVGGFGFPQALYHNANEGYPIIEIDAVGFYGTAATYSSYREILTDVARNKIDLQVEGAITARGPVTQSGSGYADGHNFNEAGTAASATCPDAPAVVVDQGLTAPAPSANCQNIPGGNAKGLYGAAGDCTAVYDPTAPGNRPLGTNPWDTLGISQVDFNAMFTTTSTLAAMPGTATNPAYVWQTADLHVTGGNGYGILVVHNPNFDPVQWAAQCPGGATGAGYCVAGNGPATFFMNGNCTYTGVVIADQILRVNGNATTVGALISIGGVNVSGDVTGNWSAKYSCDAINKALGGFGYGTKVSWHRVR
jgi:type II secretory pathway pseudopilin PulG